jgi:hypothetical protein
MHSWKSMWYVVMYMKSGVYLQWRCWMCSFKFAWILELILSSTVVNLESGCSSGSQLIYTSMGLSLLLHIVVFRLFDLIVPGTSKGKLSTLWITTKWRHIRGMERNLHKSWWIGAKYRWVISFNFQLNFPWGKRLLYPLDSRLDEHQSHTKRKKL